MVASYAMLLDETGGEVVSAPNMRWASQVQLSLRHYKMMIEIT